MMSNDEINQKIDKFFVKEKSEVLEEELEEMKGWFYFNNEEIGLSPEAHKLAKKWQYLVFLIASYVADFRGIRDTNEVEHKEADEYFGWANGGGRSAKDYASAVKGYITDGEDGKKVPPGKFSKAVEKIKEEISDE